MTSSTTKRIRRLILGAITAVGFIASTAQACDICALYSAARLRDHQAGAFTLGISEQYTDYDRSSGFAENSVKNGDFTRSFSTTQFSLGYDISDRVSLLLNVPVMVHRFDEVRNYRSKVERDTDFGDSALLGSYSFLRHEGNNSTVIAALVGGVKFPTGETEAPKSDAHSDEPGEAHAENGELHLRNHVHVVGGSLGGKSLTFGSGSYDYILGVNAFGRYKRWLMLVSTQYTLRTEGDFNYEFADDFQWNAGPGYFFALDDAYTFAARLSMTGEHKGKDRSDGALVDESDLSDVYLGPELLFTYGERVSAELGAEFCVTDADSNDDVASDFRIRSSLRLLF